MSDSEYNHDMHMMQKQLLDSLYYLYMYGAGDQELKLDAAINIACALGLSKEFKQMIGG